MHECVITDAFSQTDGNLYGTSAMIAYATSGYFVAHCRCRALHEEGHSSGKEMICPERMEDEAVREGEKTIARVTAFV